MRLVVNLYFIILEKDKSKKDLKAALPVTGPKREQTLFSSKKKKMKQQIIKF